MALRAGAGRKSARVEKHGLLTERCQLESRLADPDPSATDFHTTRGDGGEHDVAAVTLQSRNKLLQLMRYYYMGHEGPALDRSSVLVQVSCVVVQCSLGLCRLQSDNSSNWFQVFMTTIFILFAIMIMIMMTMNMNIVVILVILQNILLIL